MNTMMIAFVIWALAGGVMVAFGIYAFYSKRTLPFIEPLDSGRMPKCLR